MADLKLFKFIIMLYDNAAQFDDDLFINNVDYQYTKKYYINIFIFNTKKFDSQLRIYS
jgi:hypothetical protein